MVRIGYARMLDPMTCNNGYLTTLVERWDASTNTFILPTRECMVFIEDIWRIFKVPIEGEPVIKVGEDIGQ